jgi:hypothetical protein
MTEKKPNRRKASAQKLEPIDWREFANDAVLKGNMSTLYRRPADEDPTAYASPEALLEIEKRHGRTVQVDSIPTVGPQPIAATQPTVPSGPPVGLQPTAGSTPTVQAPSSSRSSAGTSPTVGSIPTVGKGPTVGFAGKRKVKAIRDIHDALTLAGQVLYNAMFGPPTGDSSRSCTKGYRQLAAETHLDKDTVRDLIAEFKDKGILRETGTYDADTRSAKTYEVFSREAVLRIWRDAGIHFVITGRQRPAFCTVEGEPVGFRPTVGIRPIATQ